MAPGPETKHAGMPTGTQLPSARTHIILARKAPVGVVFRRGPSKWVHVVKWNTDTDTFEHGQWFHGQMYPRRCDLSPSGDLLVYFCAKWSGRRIEEAEQMLEKKKAGALTYDLRLLLKRRPKARTEYTYAWTAVSKPPYLTALASRPQADRWHGGGLFTGIESKLFNHKPLVAIPHRDHLPVAYESQPNPDACGEDDLYIPCAFSETDGRSFRIGSTGTSGTALRPTSPRSERRFRGQNPKIKLVMNRSISMFKYKEDYSVVSGSHEVAVRADWADWDYSGRLLFARNGRLFVADLHAFPHVAETQLLQT